MKGGMGTSAGGCDYAVHTAGNLNWAPAAVYSFFTPGRCTLYGYNEYIREEENRSNGKKIKTDGNKVKVHLIFKTVGSMLPTTADDKVPLIPWVWVRLTGWAAAKIELLTSTCHYGIRSRKWLTF